MKTSVLYGPRYRSRAHLPIDERVDRSIPEAKFEPAHTQHWKTCDLKKHSQKKPDMIRISSRGFALNRGAVVGYQNQPAPRVITAEYVERLHKIDSSIEKLMTLRCELMEEAAIRGRPLKKEDCTVDGA